MMRGATLPHVTECRDCHDPIRFVTMPQTSLDTPARRMPVNPKPGNLGTVAAALIGRDLVGHVITPNNPQKPHERYLFRPHFATCEARAPKPAPAPEPTLF